MPALLLIAGMLGLWLGFDAGKGHVLDVLSGGYREQEMQGLVGFGFATRVEQSELQCGVADRRIGGPIGV